MDQTAETLKAQQSAKRQAAKPTAKPAKPAKPEAPQAQTLQSGKAYRCQVQMGSKQCQNPARWAHGKAYTCTTHHLSILKGRQVRFTAAKPPVDQSIWSAK